MLKSYEHCKKQKASAPTKLKGPHTILQIVANANGISSWQIIPCNKRKNWRIQQCMGEYILEWMLCHCI